MKFKLHAATCTCFHLLSIVLDFGFLGFLDAPGIDPTLRIKMGKDDISKKFLLFNNYLIFCIDLNIQWHT